VLGKLYVGFKKTLSITFLCLDLNRAGLPAAGVA
jgi:hypothetical protein